MFDAGGGTLEAFKDPSALEELQSEVTSASSTLSRSEGIEHPGPLPRFPSYRNDVDLEGPACPSSSSLNPSRSASQLRRPSMQPVSPPSLHPQDATSIIHLLSSSEASSSHRAQLFDLKLSNVQDQVAQILRLTVGGQSGLHNLELDVKQLLANASDPGPALPGTAPDIEAWSTEGDAEGLPEVGEKPCPPPVLPIAGIPGGRTTEAGEGRTTEADEHASPPVRPLLPSYLCVSADFLLNTDG